MFGSTEKDVSQLLGDDTGATMYDDLEILEEYLGGVALPPLESAEQTMAVEGWPEEEESDADLLVTTPLENAEEAAGPTFTTSTMAEIYVSQGFIQRAIDIYEEMLTESPLNEGIIQRLSELQDLLSASHAATPQPEISTAPVAAIDPPAVATSAGKGVVETLETWLDNINRRR